MGFKDYFDEFCKKNEYQGKFEYDKEKNEYSIIISKEDDNAGAFLSREELQVLSNHQIQSLLDFLHKGFIEKFYK